MISLRPTFTKTTLQRQFNEANKLIEQRYVNIYIKVGKMFVELARENATFQNHTWDLRSSFGYIVMKDNLPISSDFQNVGPGTSADNSFRLALAEAKKAGISGIYLIVIAGMDYALYVEDMGKDVLTGSSYAAERELRIAIQAA